MNLPTKQKHTHRRREQAYDYKGGGIKQEFGINRYKFPGGASGKEYTCQYRRYRRPRFDPWVGKMPWRRKWQPSPVFLPGKSHGQTGLVGYSPWGCRESDMTEHI